jgi:hypothetical protein
MANPKKGRRTERGSRSPLRVPDVAMPRDREKPGSVVLPGLAMAAGIVLFLFLLRFAIDVLIWVLVLALFAVVLHVIMVWLAHSELLTAPWLFIIFLGVGAVTWMFWPGSSFQEGLDVSNFLPLSSRPRSVASRDECSSPRLRRPEVPSSRLAPAWRAHHPSRWRRLAGEGSRSGWDRSA